MQQLFVRDRSFYRRILSIALPIGLQNVVTVAVNFVDTVMVGQLGSEQLAAVSLVAQFYTVFQLLCIGIGSGTAVMTSQYWGAKNVTAVKQTVTITLRVTGLLSLLFLGLCLCFPAQILTVYCPSEPRVVAYGVEYMRYFAYQYLIQGFTLSLAYVLRSVGVLVLPLAASLVAFAVKVLCNWALIFGNLGLAPLGLAGAGIATLAARLVEGGLVCGYFFLRDQKIGYRLRDVLRPCGDKLKLYLTFCLPAAASDLIYSLGDNCAAVIIGRLGSNFVAANAIVAVAIQICAVFVQGVSNGSGIITGNTLGQGERQRAYRQGITFLVLGAALGLACAVGIVCLRGVLIGCYPAIPQETKDIANQLMLALGVVITFQVTSSVMTKGVLRGGGDTRRVFVADMVCLWCFALPLGYIGGLVLGWAPFWIYVALKSDLILKAFWGGARMLRGKWIRVLEE